METRNSRHLADILVTVMAAEDKAFHSQHGVNG